MTSFYPENIPAAVCILRADNEVPKFRSNTLAKPLSGGQCQIFKLGFLDDTQWAVRIPIYLSHCARETVVVVLKNELDILQRLEGSGFSWSPKVMGHDLTFNNPVGFPYLVLSWIPGSPLLWTDTIPSRRSDRDNVISQMAKIIISLVSCTSVRSKSLNFHEREQH